MSPLKRETLNVGLSRVVESVIEDSSDDLDSEENEHVKDKPLKLNKEETVK